MSAESVRFEAEAAATQIRRQTLDFAGPDPVPALSLPVPALSLPAQQSDHRPAHVVEPLTPFMPDALTDRGNVNAMNLGVTLGIEARTRCTPMPTRRSRQRPARRAVDAA